MKLRFGSVCSGIEAATVAWSGLGWEAAWFREIEKFPCELLAHHYPNVKNLGDMTTIADRIVSGEVEAPDILCGGTPCQAFSVAGLRKSLDDERGNLSLKFCELANAIDSVRSIRGLPPVIVFWENVPGVLSTKDNAFGCFLGGLAQTESSCETPSGKFGGAGVVRGGKRQVAWRTLDAQYFGVPQRRRRVFVVASAREGFDPSKVLFERQSLSGNSQSCSKEGKGSTGFIEGSFAQYRGSDAAGTVRASGGSIGGGRDTPRTQRELMSATASLASGQKAPEDRQVLSTGTWSSQKNEQRIVGTLTSGDLEKRVNNQVVSNGLLIVQ